MAYPAKKTKPLPEFKIIDGGKNKRSNLTVLIIVFLLAIITALLVVDNFDMSNDSKTVKSAIDWDNPPCSPKELSSEWEEKTHHLMKKHTPDKRFVNRRTGEIIEFHPYNSKGEYIPHWHRLNPNKTNRFDYNFDKDGNEVQKHSPNSHIYTNCK